MDDNLAEMIEILPFCETVVTDTNDLDAFIAVVEYGSLTEAARRTNKTLQATSRSLAKLENEVGTTLIARTTRRAVPSEAGQAFYQKVKNAVATIKDAKREAAGASASPSGILRIGAPVLFGPRYLVPIIAEYQQLYPSVDVDLHLSDGFADLAQEGLDVAIRIAELPDSSLRAKRLGALRRVVFGAPTYFAERGKPQHPRELRHHECVVRTGNTTSAKWTFSIEGRSQGVTVAGRFRTNTMPSVYAAVRAGLGLGYSPLWQIHDLVAKGDVELVLQDFEPKPVPIHALWQESRNPPAKIRTFIDLLAARSRLADL